MSEAKTPEWSGKKTLGEKSNRLAGKTALRNHYINCGKYQYDIKAGDDLGHIHNMFYQTLITEKVIKE